MKKRTPFLKVGNNTLALSTRQIRELLCYYKNWRNASQSVEESEKRGEHLIEQALEYAFSHAQVGE